MEFENQQQRSNTKQSTNTAQATSRHAQQEHTVALHNRTKQSTTTKHTNKQQRDTHPNESNRTT
jgi:hypothetical protein